MGCRSRSKSNLLSSKHWWDGRIDNKTELADGWKGVQSRPNRCFEYNAQLNQTPWWLQSPDLSRIASRTSPEKKAIFSNKQRPLVIHYQINWNSRDRSLEQLMGLHFNCIETRHKSEITRNRSKPSSIQAQMAHVSRLSASSRGFRFNRLAS